MAIGAHYYVRCTLCPPPPASCAVCLCNSHTILTSVPVHMDDDSRLCPTGTAWRLAEPLHDANGDAPYVRSVSGVGRVLYTCRVCGLVSTHYRYYQYCFPRHVAEKKLVQRTAKPHRAESRPCDQTAHFEGQTSTAVETDLPRCCSMH